MEPAFWDTSSLVPLFIKQSPSVAARKLISSYQVVVWWCTPVELRGAFARLLRTGEINHAGYGMAQKQLELLRLSWREIEPTEEIRTDAESLLDRFPLKSADSLQLAAALAWCGDRPQSRPFISGDKQLLSAASQLSFHPISA